MVKCDVNKRKNVTLPTETQDKQSLTTMHTTTEVSNNPL